MEPTSENPEDFITSTEQSDFTTEGAKSFNEFILTDSQLAQIKIYEDLNFASLIIYKIMAVFIAISNLMIIIAVLKYKNLRSSTNILIVSLALADLLNCPSLLLARMHPYIPVAKYYDIYIKIVICLPHALTCASVSVSQATFVLLAIERWLAVTFPLKFKSLVTVKKIVIAVVVTWMYTFPIGSSLVMYYAWQKPMEFYEKPFTIMDIIPQPVFIFLGPAHYFVFIVIVICLYTSIAVTLKRRSNFQNQHSNVVTTQNTKRVTQMTFIILALSLIIWVPYTIALVYSDKLSTTLAGYISFQILLYLISANSFMNIFIYAWKNKAFRDAFKDMLCCGKQ
uniref:Orphan G-protein coupled receptor 19 n=1 Tax=Platynereis dumerilii TaxID=6359 RepID=A0A0K0PUF4_PLADU|nr:orphan G-protein coupled receptor 19 [Platynereis dumerilii]